MRKEIIEAILAILVIVGMAFTANAYFAKQSDLVLVSSTQQIHLVSHAIQEIQSQMWQIEGKYGTSDCFKYSPQDRERYRKLQEKLRKLIEQQNALIRKTTKGG